MKENRKGQERYEEKDALGHAWPLAQFDSSWKLPRKQSGTRAQLRGVPAWARGLKSGTHASEDEFQLPML